MIEGYYYLTEKGKDYLTETQPFCNGKIGNLWKLKISKHDWGFNLQLKDLSFDNSITFSYRDLDHWDTGTIINCFVKMTDDEEMIAGIIL